MTGKVAIALFTYIMLFETAFPSLFSHINTYKCNFRYVKDEQEWSWWASHFDVMVHGDTEALVYCKNLNPDMKFLLYQLDLTVMQDDQTELNDLAEFCADNGYEFEDCFLHFYDDTRCVLRPGDTVTVPGWIGGSAQSKEEARLPGYRWTSYRWVYWPAYEAVQRYHGSKFWEITHHEYPGGHYYDGIFLDEHCPGISYNLPTIISGGTVLEYLGVLEIDDAYIGDVADMLQTERTMMGDEKLLLPNTGNWYDYRIKWQGLAAKGVQTEIWIYMKKEYGPPYWDFAKFFADSSRYFVFYTAERGEQTGIPAGSYPSYQDREDIYLLASYYIQKDTLNYFAIGGGWDQPLVESCWFPAIEYDVGEPIDTHYLYQTGVDPTGHGYRIYARDYTKARILIRPLDRWDRVDFGDNTAVVCDLGEAYRPLQADGSLGESTTQFVLRNSEAAILTLLTGCDSEVSPPYHEYVVLLPCFPNPFIQKTKIPYRIGNTSTREDLTGMDLKVYNVYGQLVRTLINGHYGPGLYVTEWDGCNDQGRPLSNGSYFYVLSSGDKLCIQKAILLK